MKKMLCLQDVSGVSEVDLAERLRIITGWKACRTEECERRGRGSIEMPRNGVAAAGKKQ